MIRVISATNEKDQTLGSYFQDCYNNLQSCLIDTGNIDIHKNISEDQCTHEFIDKELPEIANGLPFIFVVYSHGNKSAFKNNSGNYVDLNNLPKLSRSFVYSTACLAGRELGPSLIQAGCKAFLGFKEESYAFEGEEYKSIYINCDNCGIVNFLTSDDTIKICFEKMKSYYNNQIDRMNTNSDVLRRAELVANRDALVLLGDVNLTRSDFDI